jgi:hypothetical protein
VTCAKCGFENVEDGVQCPRCARASASITSGSGPNSPISEDFLLGNTKAGLERIRARLLDLTNRNRLLNFRHTSRSSLAIVGVLPDALFDTLLEGDPVTFKPVPEPNTSGPKPKVVDYARQIGLSISVDLAEAALLPVVRGKRTRQVQTLRYPNDLEAILRRISYTAKTAIEESETKMLHLIFGFLEWFESESSDQPHLAPLLLLPVTIEKGKARSAGVAGDARYAARVFLAGRAFAPWGSFASSPELPAFVQPFRAFRFELFATNAGVITKSVKNLLSFEATPAKPLCSLSSTRIE